MIELGAHHFLLGIHCWSRIRTCWSKKVACCWWCCYEESWWKRSKLHMQLPMAFVLFISLWKASQNQKNWLLDSTWFDLFEPILHLGKEFTIWPGSGLSMPSLPAYSLDWAWLEQYLTWPAWVATLVTSSRNYGKGSEEMCDRFWSSKEHGLNRVEWKSRT